MSDRVDLLGDDLVHVQRVQPPADVSLHDAVPSTREPSTPTKGLCALCSEKDAVERCLHCQRSVCREHFWIMLGLCKSCATEEELEVARQGTNRPRPDLDIKWVEE